ncbi:uncharacterized protein LOC116450042 isoform X3 [Corvus moneduloides]|uniref:uncharacterized protein LOC116450042 isoform X3 n=1 Tax=Corvus moneduloides TaxID=1196302 RepID=UPI0013631763|nr:uncharacterized protein LOC116450042 isoform X3 [Corvus moneduloides]
MDLGPWLVKCPDPAGPRPGARCSQHVRCALFPVPSEFSLLFVTFQIVTGLYLGNIRDSEDHENLLRKGVTHILSVHNRAKPVLEDMTYLCISASDSSSENLTDAWNDLLEMKLLRGAGRNSQDFVGCCCFGCWASNKSSICTSKLANPRDFSLQSNPKKHQNLIPRAQTEPYLWRCWFFQHPWEQPCPGVEFCLLMLLLSGKRSFTRKPCLSKNWDFSLLIFFSPFAHFFAFVASLRKGKKKIKGEGGGR